MVLRVPKRHLHNTVNQEPAQQQTRILDPFLKCSRPYSFEAARPRKTCHAARARGNLLPRYCEQPALEQHDEREEVTCVRCLQNDRHGRGHFSSLAQRKRDARKRPVPAFMSIDVHHPAVHKSSGGSTV